MRRVEPKVFLIGESMVSHDGLKAYLKHIGTKWLPQETRHAQAGVGLESPAAESLVEVMGRLCYRSWEPGMNPNVTKIREDRNEYIGNILKSGHGSVIEHPVSHWIFADVSRVFTHEVVRHRVGTAFSQESLRYVRLTDLALWLPEEFEENRQLVELFETTFRSLEEFQLRMAKIFDIDNIKSFDKKKQITSTMRRLAPIGLATSIGITFNIRALRHLITMRTDASAEAEMRLVFDKVASIATLRWPSLFQDFTKQENGSWKPKYLKV